MRRRKKMCLHRRIPPKAVRAHERWNMDFIHDPLFDGRPFRMRGVVDQLSQLSPLIEPRFGFGGRDVVAALDHIIDRAGTPLSITVDHGREFTSRALEDWAYKRAVKLDFTHPGKPAEKGHIESLNGRLRDECLNINQFRSLEDAWAQIEDWRVDYNARVHTTYWAIGHRVSSHH
jgi:putative transposase